MLTLHLPGGREVKEPVNYVDIVDKLTKGSGIAYVEGDKFWEDPNFRAVVYGVLRSLGDFRTEAQMLHKIREVLRG